MPISYSIDTPNRLIVLTLRGEISADDVFAHTNRIQADPRFNNDYERLIDMGNSRIAMTKPKRQEFNNTVAEKMSMVPANMALVSTNPIEVANSMIFRSQLADDRRFMIFSTHEAALEWLNKPIRSKAS